MEPIKIALLVSATLNGALLIGFISAWRATDRYIKDRDHWHDRAIYWRTLFDDLRRNCIVRNPKTGRYMKDFTK